MSTTGLSGGLVPYSIALYSEAYETAVYPLRASQCIWMHNVAGVAVRSRDPALVMTAADATW